MLDRLDLSRSGWGRVILGTIAGTLACAAIALSVDSFTFLRPDAPASNRTIMVNVLLPTEAVAERVRRAVHEVSFGDGTPHQLTVSVGGVYFDTPRHFRELFRIADRQLYRAKREGRDQVALAPAVDAVPRVAA